MLTSRAHSFETTHTKLNPEMNAETVDYGPLAPLLGTWQGDKGLDVAPEPEGSEESPYFETIVFEPAGAVENAESQNLAAVRYHQVVSRKADGKVFHDQVGYWTWDAEAGVVVQSVTIPRGVSVLAGGKLAPASEAGSPLHLEVSARADDPDWSLVQAPFMRDNASTLAFQHHLEVDGGALSYRETTTLMIYGRTFEHSDRNELQRSE